MMMMMMMIGEQRLIERNYLTRHPIRFNNYNSVRISAVRLAKLVNRECLVTCFCLCVCVCACAEL